MIFQLIEGKCDLGGVIWILFLAYIHYWHSSWNTACVVCRSVCVLMKWNCIYINSFQNGNSILQHICDLVCLRWLCTAVRVWRFYFTLRCVFFPTRLSGRTNFTICLASSSWSSSSWWCPVPRSVSSWSTSSSVQRCVWGGFASLCVHSECFLIFQVNFWMFVYFRHDRLILPGFPPVHSLGGIFDDSLIQIVYLDHISMQGCLDIKHLTIIRRNRAVRELLANGACSAESAINPVQLDFME